MLNVLKAKRQEGERFTCNSFSCNFLEQKGEISNFFHSRTDIDPIHCADFRDDIYYNYVLPLPQLI